MATEEVFKFMKDQNRPFSINDILQSMGKDSGKTSVQKALDKLVENGKILEKIYGKQKVYCIVQDNDVKSSDMDEDLKKIDREINEISNNLKEKEDELHKNVTELKSMQGKMTTEEAKVEESSLKEEMANLKARLTDLKENTKPISDTEKAKICGEHEKYVKEYKKRKRICMDIVNSIMEGYPKTKKDLLEDIGIETDEDVGFNLDI